MPPGFHRHVLVTPAAGAVSAWVEDDYHHMGVTLHHDGDTIRRVETAMFRTPWSTCPGAGVQLAATFTGSALDAAAGRGEKTRNCTHLYDMAVLAAAHARDAAATRFVIFVSDAVGGERIAEIARNGMPMMRLVERASRIIAPQAAGGGTLFELGDWIATLHPAMREAARLLRWGAIIAHGRAIPLDRQSDATRMPANCFTFQPGRRERAVRVGRIVDFSVAGHAPLEGSGGAL